MIANIVLVIIIFVIITSIITYLVRAKRRGETCVGCPYAKDCGSKECGKDNKS